MPCARCSPARQRQSVRQSGGRAGGRAHRVLCLSRSLPPLQISSTEPPKRGTRYGVIRLVEQRVDFQREVVDSLWSRWILTCKCQKLYGHAVCFYHRKLCARVAFLICTEVRSSTIYESWTTSTTTRSSIFPWVKKIDAGADDKVGCPSRFS